MKLMITEDKNDRAALVRRFVNTIGAILGLSALTMVSSSAQTPTGTSPNVPTPYSWSMFHAGGPLTPNAVGAGSASALLDPGYYSVMGTPTGIFHITGAGYTSPGTLVSAGQYVTTQIPSYLLAYYDPNTPPGGVTVTGTTITTPSAPNNFSDQVQLNTVTGLYEATTQFQIVAPYAYLQANAAGIQIDDTGSTGFTNSGFTLGTDAATQSTATNSTYHYAPHGGGANSVTWTIPITVAGLYQVSAHIPTAPAGTTLIQDAQYVIGYTDTNNVVHAPTALPTVNQQNSILIRDLTLGPAISVKAGTNIVVTLTDQSASTTSTDIVLADSVTATPSSQSLLTVDDDNTFNLIASDQFANPSVIGDTAWTTGIADTTATNLKYTRILATPGTPASSVSHVSWSFTAPVFGIYSVYLHIPGSQLTSITEYRVRDAHYTIEIFNAAGTRLGLPIETHISQTEANALQPLVGPFTVPAQGTVKVTLDNTSSTIDPAHVTQTYVIADSMSLQSSSGGIVNGSPIAINATEYPEIKTASYVGLLANQLSTPDATVHGYSSRTAPTAVAVDYSTIPPTISGGTPPVANDHIHPIRQLVYFGRSEFDPVTQQQKGYIYCVDGFTGGVVWRFKTLPIRTSLIYQADDAPFSTPAIARINVLTSLTPNPNPLLPGTPVYSTKLVVVVGDNTGKLYCLDAVGNGDGTALDPNIDPTHIGTTTPYWIYRPDAAKPRFDDPTDGANLGKTKTPAQFNSSTDLPVPAAFGTASPVIVVNQNTALGTSVPASNSTIYIGDSHGTFYSFDGGGVPPTTTDATYSDPFNIPLVFGTTMDTLNTPKPNWWFMIRSPSANNSSNASIESAPAVYVTNTTSPNWDHTVYFGSSHEIESGSNVGRLYAIDSAGPVNSNTTPTRAIPGTHNYNVIARSKWTFPDAYGNGRSSNNSVRAALGNISGSPVVFTIPGAATPRIYFAANVGVEVPFGSSTGTAAAPRPADDETGRIWAVDAVTGGKVWAYPNANDPNDQTKDTVAEPSAPIGAFLHMTPAMGTVQFQKTIQYVDSTYGTHDYVHSDLTGDVKGNSVPMLYAGTSGVQDTAFYALDVNSNTDATAIIYRLDSPSGEIFQSSPALIVNSSTTAAGGNSGAVYTTVGNSLVQMQATPISNLVAGQMYPFVGVAATLLGYGPISSPAIAAADVTDLKSATATGTDYVQDWIYVNDNVSGYLHGVTPGKNGTSGIDLTTIVPTVPPYDEPPTGPINKSLSLHTHIFDGSTTPAPGHPSNSADIRLENPLGGDVPVFEWGSNVYIRISNVIPPNPGDTDMTLRMPDPDDPTYYYTNGSAITFQLTDLDRQGNQTGVPDSGVIPGVMLDPLPLHAPTATVGNLPGDGIVERFDTPTLADELQLKTAGNYRFIGAYTYGIRDGSNRLNTPGSRRRVLNARQVAEIHKMSDNSLVGTVILESSAGGGSQYQNVTTGQTVQSVPTQDPTFSILNPLAVAGGGYDLTAPATGTTKLGTISSPTPTTNLWQLGEVGPFASYQSASAALKLQALTNGNNLYSDTTNMPKNGVGGPVDPTSATLAGIPTAPKAFDQVISATGMINHGTSGDNAEIAIPATMGGYSLNVADRSQLFAAGMVLQVAAQRTGLQWNDLTGSNGPAARINPLNWDDSPTSQIAGANHSVDYPDISNQHLNFTLKPPAALNLGDTNITGRAGLLPGSNGNPVRVPVQASITVPKYQPADIQTFSQPPNASNHFAAGYVSTVRVFVDTNHTGQHQRGEAYRFVSVQTAVPVDMKTSIAESVLDVGSVPQGFAIQTYRDTNVGAYDPTNPNSMFVNSFQPVTVYNNGNVNLWDIHFDQRLGLSLTANPSSLLIGADTIDAAAGLSDPSSNLFAYDVNGLSGWSAHGGSPFLLRSSLDTDFTTANNFEIHTGLDGTTHQYPGATFHKARVGDQSPTVLTIPDTSYNNFAGTATTTPKIGVSVPFGTPLGTYRQKVRMFEGTDLPSTFPYTYDWLKAPQYLTKTDVFTLNGSNAMEPYSDPGPDVKVTVTENRLTRSDYAANPNGYVKSGSLQHIGSDASNGPQGASFSPAAFRDSYWIGSSNSAQLSGTGNLLLYFTAPPVTASTTPYELFGYTVPFHMASNSDGFGYFDPTAVTGSPTWWSPLNNFPIATASPTATINSTVSVAQEQETYYPSGDVFGSSGQAYAFVQNVNNPVTGAETRLYCLPLNVGNSGTVGTLGSVFPAAPLISTDSRLITSDLSTDKYGLRGLKIANNTIFPDTNGVTSGTPNGTAPIQKDLWAFWYTGTRGRTGISYSAATTDSRGAPVANTSGAYWLPQANLPIPAGLSSVADPTARLAMVPSDTIPLIPAIEVTYTGVGADGNSDIYASRYQPYHPSNAAGAENVNQTLLRLIPSPAITESLSSASDPIWWQARDVAWVRNNSTLIYIKTPGNSYYQTTLAGLTGTYDRASSLWVFPNVSVTTSAAPSVITTIYIDTARGRVRFSPALPTGSGVAATFQPLARRITVDALSDSAPSAFLDDSWKGNAANLAATSPTAARVQNARMWYFWRKAGVGNPSAAPKLYEDAQRLTIALGSGIALSSNMPQVTVTDLSVTPNAVLYDSTNTGAAVVDVDALRGRIYFPVAYLETSGGAPVSIPSEGHMISVAYTPVNTTTPITVIGQVHWIDEPRFNDTNNDAAANFLPLSATTSLYSLPYAPSYEAAVPLNTTVNESAITAFLDPWAYANVKSGSYNPLSVSASGTSLNQQPSKIWMFWTTTQNNVPDLYSATLNPRFSAAGP